jgi:hypothetical protein
MYVLYNGFNVHQCTLVRPTEFPTRTTPGTSKIHQLQLTRNVVQLSFCLSLKKKERERRKRKLQLISGGGIDFKYLNFPLSLASALIQQIYVNAVHVKLSCTLASTHLALKSV